MRQTMVDAIKCALIHRVHTSAVVIQDIPKSVIDARVFLPLINLILISSSKPFHFDRLPYVYFNWCTLYASDFDTIIKFKKKLRKLIGKVNCLL